jgi:hypothetical protein
MRPWADFNYSLITTPGLPGKTHAGFTGVAQSLMAGGERRGRGAVTG